MLTRLVAILSSLRLTVVLLALAVVLVFWGTIAQVSLGLYRAQGEFFRSFFIYWHGIPIFPGGYLVGTVLLVNLVCAHFRYYQPGQRKIGIVMIHIGVVLLLVGQLLTDKLSIESRLHLRQGERKNYTESADSFELAITDVTGPASDTVVAISERQLVHGGTITHPVLPFAVRVDKYFLNSALSETQQVGFAEIQTTAGIGPGIWWKSLPRVTEMDRRDVPSGIVEVAPIGTFLVSAYLVNPQVFTHNNRQYTMALRPTRYYRPFHIELLEFRHDKYPGTDIPKNFSSRVRVDNPKTGEDREVLIYMNNPLRYDGETYYQASFDPDNQGTVLQVVRNPSWLTPYFSCILVGAGLCVQFLQHLIGFVRKRDPK